MRKRKKELIKLLNGCSRTEVYFSPKDCLLLKANSEFPRNWFVECRFYDPEYKEAYPYPKGFQYRKKFSGDDLQVLKLTAKLFKEEMEKMLDEKKFNPISKNYMTERKTYFHPYMPFVKALEKAYDNLKSSWSKNHAKEVKRCIGHVNNIKDKLDFSELLISDVRTWHIKTILDELELTNSVFNKSRSYLQACFKELTQYGCCENNPVNGVSKKIEEETIREVISENKLKYVFKFLQDKYYTFFRYGKIFFYSGGRTTELFRVQKKHVDLINQEYKVLIKKGKQYTWVKKVIIPASYSYWKEVIDLCEDNDDFLFSKNLEPGSVAISAKQISIRWKRHVKDKVIKDDHGEIIEVTEDFYSLKHLFLDKLDEMSTAPIIPIESPSQRMANHTTENTTNIYTKGKTSRKNADLKRIKLII
ncbi:site-specific integrase [Chryseobacterium piperi]|nr:hypothetical protein [Chryseobacterium piperi]